MVPCFLLGSLASSQNMKNGKSGCPGFAPFVRWHYRGPEVTVTGSFMLFLFCGILSYGYYLSFSSCHFYIFPKSIQFLSISCIDKGPCLALLQTVLSQSRVLENPRCFWGGRLICKTWCFQFSSRPEPCRSCEKEESDE